MPANTQLNWIKDSIHQNRSSNFEVKCRIARIEVNCSSWQALKKLKFPFSSDFDIFSRYFASIVNASLLQSLNSLLQNNKASLKQTPGHNYENTMYQTGPCPLCLIDHFTVVCLGPWPLSESEAGVDSVLIQTFLLFTYKSG